jgi:transposase-like protein
MAVSFKGAHFPQDIILMGVRWYVAYPLSTPHVEELMLERGVHVDHSTINRWVVKYSLQFLVIKDSGELARHRSSSHKSVNFPANYRRSACR